MAAPDVTSNYDPAMPGKTWALVRSLRSGTAVFTQRRWAWVLDRRIFPQIYWHLILKGRA